MRHVHARESALGQLLMHLLVGGAHLLKADDIGLGMCQPLETAAPGSGPDAIDIGRDRDERNSLGARQVSGHRLLEVDVDCR